MPKKDTCPLTVIHVHHVRIYPLKNQFFRIKILSPLLSTNKQKIAWYFHKMIPYHRATKKYVGKWSIFHKFTMLSLWPLYTPANISRLKVPKFLSIKISPFVTKSNVTFFFGPLQNILENTELKNCSKADFTLFTFLTRCSVGPRVIF